MWCWMVSIWAPESSISLLREPIRSAAKCCAPSDRCGMAMKFGCSPPAALCTLHFRHFMRAAFSGFYLALMMVLWLLILRGISIELRSHIESHLGIFMGFGVRWVERIARPALWRGIRQCGSRRAIGLGRIFLPSFVDQLPARPRCGHCGLVHAAGGSNFLRRAGHSRLLLGGVEDRRRFAGQSPDIRTACWWALVAFTAAITFFSFRLQPDLNTQFEQRPWGYVFPLLVVLGLAGMYVWSDRHRDLATFLASCLYLVGMLTSATFGLYPYVLPSNVEPETALTISNAAAAPYGLYVGLAWWIPGMLLAGVYSFFVYRHFAGKVSD